MAEDKNTNITNTNSEIVIYQNDDGSMKIDVTLEDNTVWLSQQQMAELFKSSRTNITEHINNIYLDGELDKNSTCQDFRQVRKEGKRDVTRIIPFYNLDMIISVGYRVNSKQGILFRKWANNILKDYLIKGYAVNNKRLEYLEKTINLIDIANRVDNNLKGNEAREIIRVISNYSKALNLLDEYDHKKVDKPKGNINNKKITYEDCIDIINKLKENNSSNVFALERDEGLKSIIGAVYQTYNGVDLYETIEEKASNFLYLITKNHVFIDGNKRIAATLFIYFLEYYNILYKDNKQIIDNNTLVALTLLIAESNPKEKDILINLVMNFLCN